MAGPIPHVMAWSIMATAAVFLGIWRRRMDLRPGDAALSEVEIAKRARIDVWGRLLVAASGLYGAAIGAIWIYS